MCANGPVPNDSLSPGSTIVSTGDLEAFLAQQRWFAGKSRSWQVTSAVNLGWLRREAPAVGILLVTVTYDDGDVVVETSLVITTSSKPLKLTPDAMHPPHGGLS